MAARLTDKQKKEIIADYVESGSYRATAKKFGVSDNTVKRFAMKMRRLRRSAQKKESRILWICLHTWRNGRKKRRAS